MFEMGEEGEGQVGRQKREMVSSEEERDGQRKCVKRRM